MTSSLKNCLTSQPDSRNSTASQSSSSGCDGSSPVTPKSLGRPHEARAEHLLPEAIDRHARRQRMLGPQQPLGEAEPVLAAARRASAAGTSGVPGATCVAPLVVLAAEEHVRHRRLAALLHHVGDRARGLGSRPAPAPSAASLAASSRYGSSSAGSHQSNSSFCLGVGPLVGRLGRQPGGTRAADQLLRLRAAGEHAAVDPQVLERHAVQPRLPRAAGRPSAARSVRIVSFRLSACTSVGCGSPST